MSRKGVLGLTSQIKDKLIQQALERRLRNAGDATGTRFTPLYGGAQGTRQPDIPEQFYRFHLHPGYQQLRIINDGAARLGVASPFFKPHQGAASATTRIGGRSLINFGSYNYLGFSGDPIISAAAKPSVVDFDRVSLGESRMTKTSSTSSNGTVSSQST